MTFGGSVRSTLPSQLASTTRAMVGVAHTSAKAGKSLGGLVEAPLPLHLGFQGADRGMILAVLDAGSAVGSTAVSIANGWQRDAAPACGDRLRARLGAAIRRAAFGDATVRGRIAERRLAVFAVLAVCSRLALVAGRDALLEQAYGAGRTTLRGTRLSGGLTTLAGHTHATRTRLGGAALGGPTTGAGIDHAGVGCGAAAPTSASRCSRSTVSGDAAVAAAACRGARGPSRNHHRQRQEPSPAHAPRVVQAALWGTPLSGPQATK